MDRSDPAPEQLEELASAWWLVFLLGVASIVAGAILVAKPSHSLSVLAVVFGVFVLLDGVVDLIRSLAGTAANRSLAAILGVLAVILGILLIRHPTHAVTLIGLVIGIWLVAGGMIGFVQAIFVPEHRILGIVISLLRVCVGLAIVSDPHIGYATLAVLVGIWLIASGLGTMVWALAIRSVKPELAATSHHAGAPA